MKKVQALLFTFCCMMCLNQARAQTSLNTMDSHNNFQYGFSIKATILFDFQKNKPNPYFRIGADVGIASTFICDYIYPAVNFEVDIYNGGLATRNRPGHQYGTDIDFIPAFTLTAGWPNTMHQGIDPNRYVSLYYFANFAIPALQNPYEHSISLGTVWCFGTDTAKQLQRIGFANANFAAGAQFSYYNDGAPPFTWLNLGDGDDRYHTGGGVISYNGPVNTALNTVEIAYHKFTGFTQSSFEASNKLFLAYMDYHDPQQQFFNRSVFDFCFANPFRGYGVQFQAYNSVTWDLQHDIHTGVLDTYHMVPYTPTTYTLGLTYFGAIQQTGIR